MRFAKIGKFLPVLLLLPVAAHAKPKWHNVYRDKGLSVAVDTAAVTRAADGSYTVWTRWDYAKARILENKISYTRLVEKAQLKCIPVVMKRVNTALYDRQGKVVKAPEELAESEVRTMSWDPPKPGSAGEKVWAAVCRHVQKKNAKK